MCVRAHQYYGVHVEVRGRLSCLHVTLGIEHRLAGSAASALYPLSPLSNLPLLF